MRKTENKLFFEMAIFFFIVILCFGLIIIKDKSESFKKNNISKEIDEYISINYKDIKTEFKVNKLVFKNNIYSKKITNNNNKDLYFIINYKNKKISSTYKKDYLEGKTLLNTLEKKINEKLNKINQDNNYRSLKITYNIKLNNCTDNIKNRLINGNYDLPLYTINDSKKINLDDNSIQEEIQKLHNYILSLKLSPKNYKITYTDLKNETKSISIEFNEELLINNINIGKLIMENNEQELNKYNVKVNRLN